MLLVSVAAMSAAPINLCSDLSSEGNNITQANVFITPHPAWQPNGGCGQWISFDNTGVGPGAISPPNDTDVTDIADATATFHEEFILGNLGGTGSLSVWADDTTRVRLVNSLNPGDGFTLKA